MNRKSLDSMQRSISGEVVNWPLVFLDSAESQRSVILSSATFLVVKIWPKNRSADEA